MLVVQTPAGCDRERQYILKVILEDFLGVDYVSERVDGDQTCITADGRKLVLSDVFFKAASGDWLGLSTLPKQPLMLTERIGLESINVAGPLPVIFGDERGFLLSAPEPDTLILHLDVLGSCFFMLSRYEEAVLRERDHYDRFPASASCLFKGRSLQRPLVNEYVELLWGCMRSLWPALKRKSRQFEFRPSHDVDHPYLYALMDWRRVLRRVGADVLRRSTRAAADSVSRWIATKRGNLCRDPYNTYDWIMDQSERRGYRSAFYFITDHTAGRIDGYYDITHPRLRALIRRIHERGHEIGLHPSHNSFLDPIQTAHEFQRLRQVCAEEGVSQSVWGGRQHNLRWSTPATFRNLEHAGLDYDSTLGFADQAGFRCGTCYEFQVYDVVERKPLKLKERPLIVMDRTILDGRYMNLGANDRALAFVKSLVDACRKYEGVFTVLWHNSQLVLQEERRLYDEIMAL